MTPEDLTSAAGEIIDTVSSGGVAIIPLDVAYGIIGHTKEAIEKIFAVKKRSYEKPSGFFGNGELHNEIHIVNDRARDIVKAIIIDNDLPFSVVAPYRRDHPMFKNMDSFVQETTTKDGTLDMLMNAGALHNTMTKLCHERGIAVVGSSANISLAGSKYRLEDIEEEVRSAADWKLEGGLSKYANPDGLSSTIIDFRAFKTVRVGVCYEQICGIFDHDFGIDLMANGSA